MCDIVLQNNGTNHYNSSNYEIDYYQHIKLHVEQYFDAQAVTVKNILPATHKKSYVEKHPDEQPSSYKGIKRAILQHTLLNYLLGFGKNQIPDQELLEKALESEETLSNVKFD